MYVEATVFSIKNIALNSDNRIEKLKFPEPGRKKNWKVLTDCVTVNKFREQRETTQLIGEWSFGKAEIEI